MPGIMLVTENELYELIKNKANIRVNRKRKSEDGRIPISVSVNDTDKVEKILNSLRKANKESRSK